MGTCTAQLIFGQNHQNHGGIIPSFKIDLYENDRPVIVLNKGSKGESGGECMINWIPTIEGMLNDCMVMAAAYILKDKNVNLLIHQSMQRKEIPTDKYLQRYDIKEDLDGIYDAAKEAFKTANIKVVVVLLNNSTLEYCVKSILDYNADVEICRSIYSREYSAWLDKTVIKGEI
jgi:hypothetical protein